ncbi:hypothetical protein IFM89_024582 [Coptis chinensis]|uniref:Cytochrome P450 n=1 Tax=Coptis chinensis TaxID=261450 RepID=A0A835LZH3_9MAGN|nr:hypothetical protein IFM89_024582 [Coptis chinensis]
MAAKAPPIVLPIDFIELLKLYSNILSHSPNATFVLRQAFGFHHIITANPLNVQHILKTEFSEYPKGHLSSTILNDFLGTGIFNADGDNWKFQRRISSHEFNTKSLRKFVVTIVETELSDHLIPILSATAAKRTIVDLQDILQRFAFDNICKIAFGFDPKYLSQSFPKIEFALAFDNAVRISGEWFTYAFPAIWKLQRVLDIGSEKKLKEPISQVREFAGKEARTK